MPQHIRNTKTPEKASQGTYVTVATMEHIAGSVLNNQSSGDKWLLSEAIIYLVKIYVDCYE